MYEVIEQKLKGKHFLPDKYLKQFSNEDVHFFNKILKFHPAKLDYKHKHQSNQINSLVTNLQVCMCL